MRTDGRSLTQLRPIKITPHVAEYAEGGTCIMGVAQADKPVDHRPQVAYLHGGRDPQLTELVEYKDHSRDYC